MNNILDSVVDQTSRDIVSKRDDFIFECLTPYGVTRENYKEFIPRIMIGELPTVFGCVREWYLDGVYIFSIEEFQHWDADPDSGLYRGVQYEWRQFVREKELDSEQED